MKISDAFPSKYLKADDLDGDVVVYITKAEMEQLGQGKDAEDKIILYFKGMDKGLAVNKTNAGTIAKLYGDDTDGWVGKPITLFATEVEFKGDMVMAIRVRLKAPSEPAQNERAAAWDAFRKQHNGQPKEAVEKEWKSMLREIFPGKTMQTMTDADWRSIRGNAEFAVLGDDAPPFEE